MLSKCKDLKGVLWARACVRVRVVKTVAFWKQKPGLPEFSRSCLPWPPVLQPAIGSMQLARTPCHDNQDIRSFGVASL